MAQARHWHVMGKENGSLVSWGGYNIASCERYNLASKAWSNTASLTSYKMWAALVQLDDNRFWIGRT